jgi:hypothetical protein
MMKFFKPNLLAVLLMSILLGWPIAADAQNIYATIHGTVTDASGAVIPGATVTALNASTGISTAVKTDSKGYYIFPQLQTGGPYTLTIESTGFTKFQTTGITLAVNDNNAIDAALKTGSSTTVIQVQATAIQVETSDTQLKTDLNATTIESLPLLGRDVVELQKTAPGVAESSDRFGTFSTNGNQTPQNAYLLDGTDINDGPLQQAGITPNPDALGEFQVITSTLNPEYYRNSGAIVSESIKSGSNQIHGSGFEFYRDTFLNNGNYFSPSRPPFHQNIYGGTLGGPILKDRIFGFVAYQGLRSATATTTSSAVFTSAELAGAFTGITGNVSSTSPNGNVVPINLPGCPAGSYWATCFPSGNAQFPTTALNSIALKLAQKYNLPQTTTIGTTPSTFFNAADTAANDQGIIRIDARVTPNDELWASSIFQSNPDTSTIPFTGATVPGFGEIDASHIKIFNASYTHTFNTTTINELRVGYYRFNFAAVYPQQVQPPSSFGFSINPQDPAAASLPTITVLNGPTFGFSTNGPQPRKDENYDYNDNFTKILGSHSLKFGAHIEKFVVSNPFYGNNSGSFSYNGAGTYSSGNSILDYFLGIPDSYAQGSGGFIDAHAWELYGYAQDSWKATASLTINYGLAWDSESPNANSQFDGVGISCYSLSTATSSVYPGGPPGLTYPGDPGCNNQGGATTKYNHFAPRFGFVWSPESGPSFLVGQGGHHDFSVRAGFGIYYNRDQEEGSLQNLSSPPFSKNTGGATDNGGSPSFANPFVDIAGLNPTTPNPYPFTPPAPHTQINWLNFGGLDINAFDKNYTTPIVYNFNLNLQRALPGAMVLQVGYVGSIGHHLISNYDADPITSAGHAACLANPTCVANRIQIHPEFPQYTALAGLTNPVNANGEAYYWGVGAQSSTGASNYNSLQVQLLKNLSHGLSFRLAYTYAHSLDNSSGLESSGFNGRNYNFVPGFSYLSYGDSDYDFRHRLAASYIYEVPILASMRNNVIAREALGGWNIAGITALQTGFPVTLMETGVWNSLWCDGYYYYSCPDSPNTSSFNIKSLNPRKLQSFSGSPASNYWFSPDPFSEEPIGTFGNTKRNFFHGPGFNYTNMSLFKNLPLGKGEVRYIQLRLEAFNVFNHANFALPNGNFSSGTFGTISSVDQPSNNNDPSGDPQPGRAVQLGGKFFF